MRLLLDEHIAEAVATQLRSLGSDVETVARWQGGTLRERSDLEILASAAAVGRIVVTYDVDTMPAAADTFSRSGSPHAGLLLISQRTMRQNEVGALVRSLQAFLAAHAGEDWTNRRAFLARA